MSWMLLVGSVWFGWIGLFCSLVRIKDAITMILARIQSHTLQLRNSLLIHAQTHQHTFGERKRTCYNAYGIRRWAKKPTTWIYARTHLNETRTETPSAVQHSARCKSVCVCVCIYKLTLLDVRLWSFTCKPYVFKQQLRNVKFIQWSLSLLLLWMLV